MSKFEKGKSGNPRGRPPGSGNKVPAILKEAIIKAAGLAGGEKGLLPGTIRALAVSYYNSLAFRSMKANTQSVYRNILDRFCRGRDKEGQEYGDKIAAH